MEDPMNTRPRTRRTPYQRPRRTARVAIRRQRIRNTPATRPAALNMASGDDDLGGCIDLTGNDSLDNGEVIDLTETSTPGSNNVDTDPVVVLTPTNVTEADTTDSSDNDAPAGRRRHGIYLHPHYGSRRRRPRNTPARSSRPAPRGRRSNSAINVDDLSDDDLPDVPFHVPDGSGASGANGGSPPSKITCPVCLETDVQIRRNRQLYSTICGHIFCSTCIKQAIDTQHMCPTCRKRLTKKQIHQIFL